MARWKLKPRAEFSGGGATSNSGIATVSAVNAVSAAEKPYKAELEYLESDGQQYIDTGYKPNNNTKVVVEYAYNDKNVGAGQFIFGCRTSFGSDDRFCASFNTANPYLQFSIHGNSLEMREYLDTNKHTIEISQDGGYIDGDLLCDYPESVFVAEDTMYLFGLNENGIFESRALRGKIYSFEIYENGELKNDFIPVLDNNDVACMYDKVTGQFFYNQGTGDFIAGPVVPEPEPPAPEPEPEPTPVALDSVDFQIGANSGENNMLNVELGFSLGGFVGDVTSVESASDTLDAVDELKKTLNEKRSEIGVSRNRIDGIIESQSIKIENLSASHSTIVDTDFAKESAALVRSQILQQATSSLLKQANITHQLALQLLQ